MLPTSEQGVICIILCQSLTDCFRSIEVLRLDKRDGSIFIFAGEELQIQVSRNGLWRFIA
ncbi:DUF6888 family protein [Phormidesmis sp. 146-12]